MARDADRLRQVLAFATMCVGMFIALSGWLSRVMSTRSLFAAAANIAFDNDPDEKRFSDRIEPTMADSVFDFLHRPGLELRHFSIDLTCRHRTRPWVGLPAYHWR